MTRLYSNTFIKSRQVSCLHIHCSALHWALGAESEMRIEILAEAPEPDIPDIKVILSSYLIVPALFA